MKHLKLLEPGRYFETKRMKYRRNWGTLCFDS